MGKLCGVAGTIDDCFLERNDMLKNVSSARVVVSVLFYPCALILTKLYIQIKKELVE